MGIIDGHCFGHSGIISVCVLDNGGTAISWIFGPEQGKSSCGRDRGAYVVGQGSPRLLKVGQGGLAVGTDTVGYRDTHSFSHSVRISI